jgi:hypothetical protein
MEKGRDFTLGAKLRDAVTGFEGVAVSRHEYLNGCVRFTLQGPLDKDGKVPDPVAFDTEQLEEVEPAPLRETKPAGGPRSEPARPAPPRR